MRTFFFKASCVGVFVCVACVTHAQAAGSSTDASVQSAAASPSTDLPADAIGAVALRWAKELDRLAYALEERALVEEGDDADIHALLTRAEHLKVRRAQLQECGAARLWEIALQLRRSVEDTPEAAPAERDAVLAVIGPLGVSTNREPHPTDAHGGLR